MKKAFYYEVIHQWRSFSLVNKIQFLICLLCTIAVSYSDTFQFFDGVIANLLPAWLTTRLPAKWPTLLALAAIGTLFMLANKSNKEEHTEFHMLVKEVVQPYLVVQLELFREKLMQSYDLQGVRTCIFIPVREGLLNWRLKMACRSGNVPAREAQTNFALDEGIVGLVLLTTGKNNVKYVDLTDSDDRSYKPLDRDNEVLVSHDLKGVLATCTVKGSVAAAIVSVDTNNSKDLEHLVKKGIHDFVMDWACANEKAIRSLWRMWNHGAKKA